MVSLRNVTSRRRVAAIVAATSTSQSATPTAVRPSPPVNTEMTAIPNSVSAAMPMT